MSTKNASLVRIAKNLNKPRNFVANDLLTSGLYTQRVERDRKSYQRKTKHKNNYDEF